jgi:DNA-binding beta-propeller fold protein YncE
MMRVVARAFALVLVACALGCLGLTPAFAADPNAPSAPSPAGIALDSDGNLYVTDYALDRIVKFAPDGTLLGQWGSTGNAPGQFSSPFGVAIDASNTLFVVDQLNNRVQRFATDGTPMGVWGTAGAGAGDLRTPFGVAISNGHVYVADFGNDRVDIFTLDGSFVSMLGGRGTGDGQFQRPAGVAIGSDGSVYVTDHFNDRVERFSGDGHYQAQIGSLSPVASAPQPSASANGTATAIASATAAPAATSTPTAAGTPGPTASVLVLAQSSPVTAVNGGASVTPDAQLQRPEGIALDHDGNVWVADYGRDRVVKLAPDGRLLLALGTKGSGIGEFVGPKGIAVDLASGHIYIADTGNGRIQRLTPDGTPDAIWSMPAAPQST